MPTILPLPNTTVPSFPTVYGVDFSGARLAGTNTWLARLDRSRRGRPLLTSLSSLQTLAGTAHRAPALSHLVSLIRSSEDSLWAMDFPFGLPFEILPPRSTWRHQLRLFIDWPHDAYALGLWCVDRTKQLHNKLHLRRTTDVSAKAPFDCYHYRIIYQTFHGIRDVLAPLAHDPQTAPQTAILPFDYKKLPAAQRALIEVCPASTLKHLRWPHQNYKQPTGGPLTPKRLRTRRSILSNLIAHIEIPPFLQRIIMRNPGGDAIDAVLAAYGGLLAYNHADHPAIAAHPRYRREGYVYV